MSTSVFDPLAIRCKRCNHLWEYKGKNIYVVTCPHCGTKIGIRRLLLGLERCVSSSSQIGHGVESGQSQLGE